MTFPVDGNGGIGNCTAGTLISCSGKVAISGDFTLTGSDGDGTNATLNGKIDAGGGVTGSFTGTSDGVAISGSFTGSRGSGSTPPVTDSSGFVTQGGLVWSRPPGVFKEYSAALEYCQTANFLGRTNWRLPHIDELKGLYQSGAYLSQWGYKIEYVYSQTPNTVVPQGQFGYRRPATLSLAPNNLDGGRVGWDTGFAPSTQVTCVSPA